MHLWKILVLQKKQLNASFLKTGGLQQMFEVVKLLLKLNVILMLSCFT